LKTTQKSRLLAFLCALVLLICALATFPVAEIGINDDWSYVQSARVLAQTGRIVYNGWATAMLGWQLYLGALFAKLFGPSFTSIRASTLLIALFTAFLTQRTLVRAGINSRNATIGTLTLVLSPLFLPLALSYMSEIGGLFCVVLCLYACLRALQANTDRSILAWLVFAALSNAVGGTVRQIAWLGVLIMFPCTVWLLRRRPYVLVSGLLLYAISIVIVFGTLHWFHQQPYSLPEPPIEGYPTLHSIKHLVSQLLILFFTFALLLLPVLIGFIPTVPLKNRRALTWLTFAALFCMAAGFFLARYHPLGLQALPASRGGNYLTPYGLVHTFGIKGERPLVLSRGFQLLITAVVLFALCCFSALLFSRRHRSPLVHEKTCGSKLLSWRSLVVLLLPFALAYIALLLPRALRMYLFDRYLLLLFPIALIFLLRLYQDRVRPNLSLACSATVLLFAAFAIAGTHDVFSMYRAQQDATNELRAVGIPDTAIDAGFEHNGLTQIERFGYINDPPAGTPFTAYFADASSSENGCQPQWDRFTPAVVPSYTLSFDPAACGGLSHFAPATYRNWLVASTIPIYIVNTVKPPPAQH
jgi:hypothetical protein